MGGTCGTYRGEIHTEKWWRKLNVREHLEYQGTDEGIILKLILGNKMGARGPE
jgi:hypothetical protein